METEILFVVSDDWEVMYVNGRVEAVGHSFDSVELLNLLSGHTIGEVHSHYVAQEEMESMTSDELYERVKNLPQGEEY